MIKVEYIHNLILTFFSSAFGVLQSKNMLVSLLGLGGFSGVAGFYLPGVAPNNYKPGDTIPMFVNSLTAKDSLLPYDYYLPDFNFCRPVEQVSQRESLGSILFGDRLFTSMFKLHALQNELCLPLCTLTNTQAQNVFIRDKISEEYNFNWIVDGLPAAQVFFDPKTSDKFYSVGIPIGSKVGKKYYLNNHYSIHIHYHKRDLDTIRVVGVVVIPHSLSPESQKNNCAGVPNPEMLIEPQIGDITYTYNVIWDEDEISWGTRWDHYLHVYDPQIHWFR
jgi:transmembrane 9 superfamily protein 2/4